MFDVGFLELLLIGVVALLVIGPNRLPEVARTAGVYVGRFRRFVSSVQQDVNREISKQEDLARLLDEQKKIVEEHEILEELNRPLHLDDEPKEENRILNRGGDASTPAGAGAVEDKADGR